MSLVFCCLAIGNIGDAGKMSLNSILAIPDSVVVVLTDPTGTEWVLNLKSDLGLSESKLCIVEINDAELQILNELDSSVDYRPFGNPKFFRLMYLKWNVLNETMSKFPKNPYFVFSDLDVFWARTPEATLQGFMESSSDFAIQLDSNSKNNRIFLCPGIMIWKNNATSRHTLEDIRSSHRSFLELNPTMPDDKAINIWASAKENANRYWILDERLFVIGHRLPFLLLGVRGFSSRTFIAYHANYTIGLANKAKLLRIAKSGTKWFSVRLFYGVIFSFGKLMARLSRAKRGVTS